MLGLQLVRDVLEEPCELDVVFLVYGATEACQSCQPHGDAGAIRLGANSERLEVGGLAAIQL